VSRRASVIHGLLVAADRLTAPKGPTCRDRAVRPSRGRSSVRQGLDAEPRSRGGRGVPSRLWAFEGDQSGVEVVDQILEIPAAPRTGPGFDGIPGFFRGATTRGLGQGVPRAGRRSGSVSCHEPPPLKWRGLRQLRLPVVSEGFRGPSSTTPTSGRMTSTLTKGRFQSCRHDSFDTSAVFRDGRIPAATGYSPICQRTGVPS
jgi:hypothetical protein